MNKKDLKQLIREEIKNQLSKEEIEGKPVKFEGKIYYVNPNDMDKRRIWAYTDINLSQLAKHPDGSGHLMFDPKEIFVDLKEPLR